MALVTTTGTVVWRRMSTLVSMLPQLPTKLPASSKQLFLALHLDHFGGNGAHRPCPGWVNRMRTLRVPRPAPFPHLPNQPLQRERPGRVKGGEFLRECSIGITRGLWIEWVRFFR